MNGFLKLIKKCRKEKSRRIIHNASFEHAKALVSELFEEAGERKEEVKIISGELGQEFYGAFCDVATKIIDKGSNIRLIVIDPNIQLNDHPFINAVIEKGGDISQLESPIDDRIKNMRHFILVGTNAFRLETDHNNAKAVASFNYPEIGVVLDTLFSEVSALPSKHIQRSSN